MYKLLPKINRNSLVKLPAPVGPHEEQVEISRRVLLAMYASADMADRAVLMAKDMGRLDHSILAKAFQGEFVPQDPSDENASVLLHRINAERGAEAGTRGRRTRRS